MRTIAVAMALLAGCAARTAPAAAPPRVGVVNVVGAPSVVSERDAIRAALAGAPVTRCYEALLQRAPLAAGDVVVRFRIGAAGLVEESSVDHATLGDTDAERCVADAVRAVQFRTPSRPGLTVVYPFLFTSGATPPEVARALRVRYGLEPEIPPGDPLDPKASPVPGIVTLW
jgi:TonB family protein